MTVTEHEPAITLTLDDETRRVFVKAKGILANGWCQNCPTDEQGRYCLVGALGCQEPSQVVYKAVYVLNTLLGMNAITWNDMPGRTVYDVIALIDRALQQ